MNYREIAARYGVSIRTAHRYVSQNAPVEDESKMRDWLDEHHSRRGVGKFSHRRDATPVTPTTPVAAPVRAGINADADIIPAVIETIKPQSAAPEEDKSSTLQRLEIAERTAYEHYIATGGQRRAAQVWLLICDQKRKLVADLQKQTTNVSEAETKFMSVCCEVVDTLWLHLQAVPKMLGLLCEGLDRNVIQAKVKDQLYRTCEHAVSELAHVIRGTSLERLLPPHERGKHVVTSVDAADDSEDD